MNTITPATPVALLGLGIIGGGIARHLRKNDWNIRVWNRTPKDDLPNDFSSPAEAAQACKIISLYLKNREACKSVLSDMLPHLTREHIIINHSTIDVASSIELAETATQAGATYWEAPFTGSKVPASQGELVYYVSGPADKWHIVEPLLKASSKAIFPFGEKTGNAMTVKLVTNLVSCVTVQALSEALGIVKGFGMTAQDLLTALNLNVCNSVLATNKIPAMDKGEFTPNFSMDNMRKDSVYVRELAQSEGLKTPAIDLVSSLMTEMCEKGMRDMDFGALALNFPSTPR